MKKWRCPKIYTIGIENTNEIEQRRPNPNIPGRCGFCNNIFNNVEDFYDHETKLDGKAGYECEKAPTNGECESIFIPLS
ncbi:hypothetical protein [Clostridium sp.]|uniref:hypothetical protein n=1 Tax=Clostridium sp. TaxID=1506 RepID=UPI003F3C9E1C